MMMSNDKEENTERNLMGSPRPEASLTVHRRLYTQDHLETEYLDRSECVSIKDRVRDACTCSSACLKRVLLSYFPLIQTIRNYSWRSEAMDDFISGLSVSFLHMPQGLALGLLASVPPVFGLYGTFYPVLIYLVFGTSRHISMGTNAVLSLITAGIVERELELFAAGRTAAPATVAPPGLETGSGGMTTASAIIEELPALSPEEANAFKVGVAAAAAFISGVFLLIMGFLKLGFITSYMAPPFVRGFTTAAAFHIATSQVPKMLNIKVKPHSGAGKIIKTYIDIFTGIGDSNPADVIVSIFSFIFILGVTIFINERYRSKMRVPVPVQLIIVIVSTIISHLADLRGRFGIAIVGDVPLGLPAPVMPNTEVMGRIATDSFVMAILTFTLNLTLAKLMAETHNYSIDCNQEVVAYGLCNFLSSFFQSIPVSTAPPRTMILSNIGSKSTLNAIVTVIFILLVLLVAGQLFFSLPVAVLAVMIATAVKNLLLQVTQLPALWRLSKPDFFIWLITFLVSVFGDLDIGIAAGLGISVLTIIVRNQCVSGTVGGLSKKEDLVVWGSNREGLREDKEFRIFYFPSQLFYANADKFHAELHAKALNPKHVNVVSDEKNHIADNETVITEEEVSTRSTDVDIKYVILECSAMTYIDFAGVNTMKKVCNQYQKVGVTLLLAKCHKYFLDVLDRSGYFKTMDRNTVFHDVYDAITCIQQGHV